MSIIEYEERRKLVNSILNAVMEWLLDLGHSEDDAESVVSDIYRGWNDGKL